MTAPIWAQWMERYMTIINNYNGLQGNSYAPLNAQTGAVAGADFSSTEALAEKTSAEMTSAFLLSLSPEAQNYLNSMGLAHASPAAAKAEFTPSASQQKDFDDTMSA